MGVQVFTGCAHLSGQDCTRMMCLIPYIYVQTLYRNLRQEIARGDNATIYIHPVQYIVAIVVTPHPTTVAPATTLALTRTNCRSDSAISMCSLVMGRRSGRDQCRSVRGTRYERRRPPESSSSSCEEKKTGKGQEFLISEKVIFFGTSRQ